MSTTSRLNKIRKLLALAEDPAATPAEVAAFTEKAMTLMARHGIDEALLAAGAGPGRVVNRRLAMAAPYARDKATLAAAIAQALRCRAVMLVTNRGVVVQVFGLRADVRSVDLLVTSLLVQAAHDMARTPVPAGEHAGAFRRSWWAGFASAVYARLRQATQTAEAEVSAHHNRKAPQEMSVELVLAHRADEIDDEVARAHPRVRRARTRRLSGSGQAEGYRSGQRADLGTLAKIQAT